MAAAPASIRTIRRDLTRNRANFTFEILIMLKIGIHPNGDGEIILSTGFDNSPNG